MGRDNDGNTQARNAAIQNMQNKKYVNIHNDNKCMYICQSKVRLTITILYVSYIVIMCNEIYLFVTLILKSRNNTRVLCNKNITLYKHEEISFIRKMTHNFDQS